MTTHPCPAQSGFLVPGDGTGLPEAEPYDAARFEPEATWAELLKADAAEGRLRQAQPPQQPQPTWQPPQQPTWQPPEPPAAPNPPEGWQEPPQE